MGQVLRNSMSASEAARAVSEKFGTGDCFVIAEKSNLKIVYGDWHPVTAGEFDRKRKTIRVNRRAVEDRDFNEAQIVAHELGHFFAPAFGLDKKAEEIFAAAFAEELIKIR